MKLHARKPFAHGIEERVEQKRDLLPVLLHELRARRAAVGEREGVVAPLSDVLFVVIERVDEVHPLAHRVEELLRRGRSFVLHEVRAQMFHEQRRRLRRLVGRGRALFFHRRLLRDERLHQRKKLRVLLFGTLYALFEPGALDSSPAAVRDVVGKLIVCERRVERAQLFGEIVHGGDGPLADGVLEAILALDLHVRPRHVVQQRRQKGDVVSKAQPRALPAGGADGLAEPAVERLVEHEVLYEQVGQIVANISEHALFSPVKSHFAVHLGERLSGGAEGALGAPPQDVCKVALVGKQALLLRLDGRERVGDRLAHRRLEVAVPHALELHLRLGHGAAPEGGIDVEKVGDARLFRGGDDAVVAVRHGAAELAQNGVFVVREKDRGVGVFVRLAHLMHGVLQRVDLRALFDDIPLGDAEGLAIAVVEADGDVARDLEVLALVDANRHDVRLIQQNVRRHQNGVIHQPHVDVLGVLGALILELRHALHLPHIGEGVEHPRKLGVRGDVGLHIQRARLGVDAAGDVERGELERAAAQLRGLLPHRDGVHIRHRIKTGKFVLQFHPVADGTHIVADGKVAAGLYRRV